MTRFTVYDPQRHHNKALDIVPHKWRSSAGWNTTPINVTDRAEGAEKTTGKRRFPSPDTPVTTPTSSEQAASPPALRPNTHKRPQQRLNRTSRDFVPWRFSDASRRRSIKRTLIGASD